MIFISKHAIERMSGRHINIKAIKMAIMYGVEKFFNNVFIYTITPKIVKALLKKEGINLKSYIGLKVILSHDNNIITTYWNEK